MTKILLQSAKNGKNHRYSTFKRQACDTVLDRPGCSAPGRLQTVPESIGLPFILKIYVDPACPGGSQARRQKAKFSAVSVPTVVYCSQILIKKTKFGRSET